MTNGTKPVIRCDPPSPGYDRQWVRCPTCYWIGYYDYLPYSIGCPIRWLPCGHDIGSRFSEFVQYLSEETVRKTCDIQVRTADEHAS